MNTKRTHMDPYYQSYSYQSYQQPSHYPPQPYQPYQQQSSYPPQPYQQQSSYPPRQNDISKNPLFAPRERSAQPPSNPNKPFSFKR